MVRRFMREASQVQLGTEFHAENQVVDEEYRLAVSALLKSLPKSKSLKLVSQRERFTAELAVTL